VYIELTMTGGRVLVTVFVVDPEVIVTEVTATEVTVTEVTVTVVVSGIISLGGWSSGRLVDDVVTFGIMVGVDLGKPNGLENVKANGLANGVVVVVALGAKGLLKEKGLNCLRSKFGASVARNSGSGCREASRRYLSASNCPSEPNRWAASSAVAEDSVASRTMDSRKAEVLMIAWCAGSQPGAKPSTPQSPGGRSRWLRWEIEAMLGKIPLWDNRLPIFLDGLVGHFQDL
jgi:hypothetical protein